MAIERGVLTMSNIEKKLYQKNKLGRSFVIFFILFNVAYSIFVLNHMDINYDIGLFIMTTILLLLVGFLTSVKVEAYSLLWSVVAGALGVFQFTRFLFTEYVVEGTLETVIPVLLVLSGVSAIIGCVVSLNVSMKRKHYIISNKISDETLQN